VAGRKDGLDAPVGPCRVKASDSKTHSEVSESPAGLVPDATATWVSVAVAAQMMGVGKRAALIRLRKLDADLDGRLLKPIGTKAMPRGTQASKFLVCLPLLRARDPEAEEQSREIAQLRVELSEVRSKLESLRKAVRPLLGKLKPSGV